MAQTGRPEGHLSFFAAFFPHTQQTRMLVQISEA
jgi:hypothetical protein